MLGFLLSLICLSGVNAQILPSITNIVPLWVGVARPAVTPLDPTASLHTLRYVTWAWFEVWAACNDTAVGPLFLGSLRRTNQAVNCTLANKNTAYAYASYRVMSIPFYSESQASFDAVMLSWGLNPADTSNDTSTPTGLGNTIGYALRDFMSKDGMNSLGDLNTDTDQGTFYGIPYADYTHYEPVQTTYNLLNPDRWQPQVESRANGNGFFGRGAKTYGNSGIQSVQTYASPHARFAAAFGFTDAKVFMSNFSTIYARYSGGGTARRQAYRKQAADIIAFSANLTDKQKIEAEFFESKNLAFGTPMPFLAANTRGSISGQQPWTVDDWVVWEFVVNAAVWDSVIVAWSTKRKRDGVRPITAVRFLYQDDTIYSWGGPGKGNVYQKGAAFKPWLKTMAHSEYPSGSSCMCASFAEANRQFFNGDDNFANFSFPVVAGSSGVEPGVVPAVNMTVGPFATFTQYAQICGQSRAHAGVHFQQSIVDALDVCKYVGANAAQKWRQYLEGTVTTPANPNNRRIYSGPEYNVGPDASLDD